MLPTEPHELAMQSIFCKTREVLLEACLEPQGQPNVLRFLQSLGDRQNFLGARANLWTLDENPRKLSVLVTGCQKFLGVFCIGVLGI